MLKKSLLAVTPNTPFQAPNIFCVLSIDVWFPISFENSTGALLALGSAGTIGRRLKNSAKISRKSLSVRRERIVTGYELVTAKTTSFNKA